MQYDKAVTTAMCRSKFAVWLKATVNLPFRMLAVCVGNATGECRRQCADPSSVFVNVFGFPRITERRAAIYLQIPPMKIVRFVKDSKTVVFYRATLLDKIKL